MQQSVRAIVTVVPLKFPDRVEIQALLVDAEDQIIGIGVIYSAEPWHVWRTRLELSEGALDDAELMLARDEAAQLGALLMLLPPDLSGREFVLDPS